MRILVYKNLQQSLLIYLLRKQFVGLMNKQTYKFGRQKRLIFPCGQDLSFVCPLSFTDCFVCLVHFHNTSFFFIICAIIVVRRRHSASAPIINSSHRYMKARFVINMENIVRKREQSLIVGHRMRIGSCRRCPRDRAMLFY